MQISANELRQQAEQVDDLHRDAMRTFHAEVEEVHRGETGTLLRRSRRRFLQQAGAGGAILTVGSYVTPIGRFLPAAWAQGGVSDVDIAVFAESVELAAVEAYKAAAGSGKLQPAVVELGTMFAGHHQEHAGAFGGVAGDKATSTPNATLLAEFGPLLQAAADQAAILEIAFTLEQAAAATYLFALGAIQDADVAAATATILPVESQHAVVLAEALGKSAADYLPSFQSAEGALDPAKYPVS